MVDYICMWMDLLATVAVLLSESIRPSSKHLYVPQYDSFAFVVCATRSYSPSILKRERNIDDRLPRSVISSVLVEPSAVNLHNTGDGRSELQFRRSKVPGINVVLSGVRVNAPSDPANNILTVHNGGSRSQWRH